MLTDENTAKKAVASKWGIPSRTFIEFSKVQLPSNYILWFDIDGGPYLDLEIREAIIVFGITR